MIAPNTSQLGSVSEELASKAAQWWMRSATLCSVDLDRFDPADSLQARTKWARKAGTGSEVRTTTCPGTVACPVTGDEVCQGECPLLEAIRADCPGKVEYPLTRKLVCCDECPLGLASAVAKPSCCNDTN